MKKTFFVCDVCHAQQQSILEAQVTVQKYILGATPCASHVIQLQVCSLRCLAAKLVEAKQLELFPVKGGEASVGDKL